MIEDNKRQVSSLLFAIRYSRSRKSSRPARVFRWR
jgi:hypothetical protein